MLLKLLERWEIYASRCITTAMQIFKVISLSAFYPFEFRMKEEWLPMGFRYANCPIYTSSRRLFSSYPLFIFPLCLIHSILCEALWHEMRKKSMKTVNGGKLLYERFTLCRTKTFSYYIEHHLWWKINDAASPQIRGSVRFVSGINKIFIILKGPHHSFLFRPLAFTRSLGLLKQLRLMKSGSPFLACYPIHPDDRQFNFADLST